MKVVRYREGDRIHYGILEERGLIRRLEGTPFESLTPDGTATRLESVRILSPVPAPRIFGLGLNYADHAAEGGKEHPPQPMLFMKPSTAAIGPGESIVYPAEEGDLEVHFEAELVAVIGRIARRVGSSEALDYVLGYTCGNDVSERVIQRAEMKEGCLLMGKGYDTFCPLGPAVVTGLDPTDLLLLARVNGRERQRTNTSDLIYPVAEIVSYMSQAITLLPGDVILTGTPSGVGPIYPGDRVEIEVPQVGVLSNPVVAEKENGS